jgi:hypothetical protein
VSVVRIPRPEEDAFPWPRVVTVAVVGGALGLGIAFWGMEHDRAESAASAESPADVAERASEPTPEVDAARAPSPQTAEPEPAPHAAPEAEPEPEPAPHAAPEAEPAPAPEVVAVVPQPAAAPAEPAPSPAPTVSGPVTLRTGRVAYLRCDGVPQRPGPFPCPRDEPLEASVWAALGAVERCDRAPGPGAADIVVDFDGAEPTIRARDTFPSDTVRTDATALLACAGDSLANVRSSLSPRRLVVSFRLTLEARAR